jgi:ribose transport system substrate-binding protein
MRRVFGGHKGWRSRSWLVAIGVLAVAAVPAIALGASSGSARQTLVSASSTAQATCGQNVPAKISDTDNVLSKLDAKTRARYAAWSYPVKASPWSTFKGVKQPWKIGLIMFPLTSPYNVDIVSEVKKEFNEAKAKGLVTGTLTTYIQPSMATATPEQQISAIQQMVRDGINGILILPLSGTPLAPAIDAAGKSGVPVVVIDNVIPNSKYVVNVWTNKVPVGSAGTAGMLKKGNVLIVRGLAGNTVEQAIYDATIADLKVCPDIKIVGTVYGSWSSGPAKTAVLQFLASHPGLKIDAVIQNGAMMAGVIQAYESTGKTVPLISEGGCQGGDLSWWLAHKATYKTYATCNNGFQVAWVNMRVLFRILGGKGVKLRDISLEAPVVTNANLAQFATPGKPLSWAGEPRGPITAYCSNTCLNGYFNSPGTPGGF